MNEIIDKEQITMLVEGAGAEAVRPILDAYWVSNEELAAQLDQSIKAADPAGIAATAHGLKGSSANLGAIKVADRAKQIELAAKSGDLKRVAELFRALPTDIEETKAAFNKVLAA
jgi:HPt (histidine-containing phosphotransfer) domain-containing protein